MQTPKRKQGKYSHLKADPNLTQAKYQALKKLLLKLRSDQKKASKEVARLAEFGDFSENHAYQMEKGRLRGINQRIIETEDLVGRATIIKPDKKRNVVQLGSVVTVVVDGGAHRYHILGSSETSPEKGVISHHSPLGSALLGHVVGDILSVESIDSVKTYTILKIS